MFTFKYKGAYIHENFNAGVITVQIFDGKNSFFTFDAKSVHAAKIKITRWNKVSKN